MTPDEIKSVVSHYGAICYLAGACGSKKTGKHQIAHSKHVYKMGLLLRYIHRLVLDKDFMEDASLTALQQYQLDLNEGFNDSESAETPVEVLEGIVSLCNEEKLAVLN